VAAAVAVVAAFTEGAEGFTAEVEADFMAVQ
jgi:hypothetical protein